MSCVCGNNPGEMRNDCERCALLCERLEMRALILELQAKVASLEGARIAETQADAPELVPVWVMLPTDVWQSLREQAEEIGRPAEELASLWIGLKVLR